MRWGMSLIVAAALIAGPAVAAGGGGHSSNSKSGNRYEASWSLAEPEEHARVEDSPSLIDMPIIVAPIVVDGRLVNYAFVSLRLDIADGRDPWKVREKTTYLRDAMIRAAHSEPLNDPDNPSQINREKAARVWMAAANRVLGDEAVREVRISNADIQHPDLAARR